MIMSKKNYKHMDDATRFKYKSLNAIERRKIIKKYSFMTLIIIALLMMIAVVAVYTIN